MPTYILENSMCACKYECVYFLASLCWCVYQCMRTTSASTSLPISMYVFAMQPKSLLAIQPFFRVCLSQVSDHRNYWESVAKKDRNARLCSKLMLSRLHDLSAREGEGKERKKYLSSSWAILFWVTVCKLYTVSFHEMFKMNKSRDSPNIRL